LSGFSVVAKRIASYDGDPIIRDLLRALFNFELENAAQKTVQYKSPYIKAIEVAAKKIEALNGEVGQK
jgi:hypothetical protein